MYTYGRSMLLYSRNRHSIVRQLIISQLQKKKKIRTDIKPLSPNKDIMVSDQMWQRTDRNMLVQGH